MTNVTNHLYVVALAVQLLPTMHCCSHYAKRLQAVTLILVNEQDQKGVEYCSNGIPHHLQLARGRRQMDVHVSSQYTVSQAKAYVVAQHL